jgi:hypothetical protein
MLDPNEQPLDPTLADRMAQHEELSAGIDQTLETAQAEPAPVPDIVMGPSTYEDPEEFTPRGEPFEPTSTDGTFTRQMTGSMLDGPDTPGKTTHNPRSPQRERRNERAAQGKQQRLQRLGRIEPPDPRMGQGTEQGTKSPQFEDVGGQQDVNSAMANHTQQLTSTLGTMARILMENCIKLEEIQNYFERLR